jgi:hypothetical protein
MKAKTKFFIAVIGILFLLIIYWALNHSYVVVPFFTWMELLGVVVFSHFLVFWIGRWTHPSEKKEPRAGGQ